MNDLQIIVLTIAIIILIISLIYAAKYGCVQRYRIDYNYI